MMKIVIVGGGMVGMTLAHLLRRRGIEPTVLERAPAGHYVPRGYMLGFQGYEPLEEVGIYDDVKAADYKRMHAKEDELFEAAGHGALFKPAPSPKKNRRAP